MGLVFGILISQCAATETSLCRYNSELGCPRFEKLAGIQNKAENKLTL